jgi:hypothetical protein
MMNKHLTLIPIALGITAASLAVKIEGHICGPDRGLPFPIITPVCGASPLHIPWDDRPKCTRTVFDYGVFTIDFLIWWGIALAVSKCSRRAQGQQKDEEGVSNKGVHSKR